MKTGALRLIGAILACALLSAGADLSAFDTAMELARAGRLAEAEQAFRAGERSSPLDKRFPLELAGVAFKLGRHDAAKASLHRALRLDPDDAYANNFLATLYFLDHNLEAALKYWNRVGKPRIEEIRYEPEPEVDPELLDRAFAFAPASVLELNQLYETRARLRLMGIFSQFDIGMAPLQNGAFDAVFRQAERNGWGAGKLDALLSALRGLPFETIYASRYNIGSAAVNFESLLRWDPDKRRAFLSLSGPFRARPHWRWDVYADARQERWELDPRFAKAPLSPALDKAAAGFQLLSAIGEGWGFSNGIEFAARRFRSSENSPRFTAAPSVKYVARVTRDVLRVPENRLFVKSSISGEAGRMFSDAAGRFAKAQASIATSWNPRPRSDDYELRWQIGAGKIFGAAPFDELYMLGIERDNDLWLRAHPGTRHGMKGSAPLGTAYLLSNWDADRTVYRNVFFASKLGPFLDIARAYDRGGEFGSRKWLWDTGLQNRVQLLGGFEAILTLGKDLRSGRNTWYVTVTR